LFFLGASVATTFIPSPSSSPFEALLPSAFSASAPPRPPPSSVSFSLVALRKRALDVVNGRSNADAVFPRCTEEEAKKDGTTTRAWKDDDVANRGTPKVPPRDDGDDDEDAVVADVSLARSCEKRDTTRDISFFVVVLRFVMANFCSEETRIIIELSST
tara:strand:- start:2160 stop:2636 length:477 start_codon:yes stop_codon:yes gene_type:complete